jgi:hypothetical protein
MIPAELTPEHFASYRPLARQIATRHLQVLRELPLAFVPLFLAELIEYDVKFPPETLEIDAQLTFLGRLPAERRREVMAAFWRLTLPGELEAIDWVRNPAGFSERLSAHLWTTGQVADFRAAAVEFLTAVRSAIPPPAPSIPRLVMVVVGQGVSSATYPLFRKLRDRGTYFTAVRPANGLRILIERGAARARRAPAPFAHWYIDGGTAPAVPRTALEVLAFRELDSVRDAVVSRLRSMIVAGTGVEARRTALMKLAAEDIGLKGDAQEAVRNHFKVTLMSEGSGVQFFSTTFVQWAAREVLRRAQPVTLLARFAPRITDHSMNLAITDTAVQGKVDPEGALRDADMAAYYTWLNQMRLPGADKSSFLVWFEDHSDALAVAPSVARGVESTEPIDMEQLLDRTLG